MVLYSYEEEGKEFFLRKRYWYKIYLMPIYGGVCSFSQKAMILVDRIKNEEEIVAECKKVSDSFDTDVCLYCCKRYHTRNGMHEEYPTIKLFKREDGKIHKPRPTDTVVIHY